MNDVSRAKEKAKDGFKSPELPACRVPGDGASAPSY